MAANSASRQTARDRLASLLTTALTGTGNPVKQVYAYPIARDSSGKVIANIETPLIELRSGGSARRDKGINDQKWFNFFYIELTTYIRPADNANGWTEQMVENQLDTIDKKIADVIADNRADNDAYWSFIGFSLRGGEIPEMSQIIMEPGSGCLTETTKIYFQVIEA